MQNREIYFLHFTDVVVSGNQKRSESQTTHFFTAVESVATFLNIFQEKACRQNDEMKMLQSVLAVAFLRHLAYNNGMKNNAIKQTDSTEMVTITRAEYEALVAEAAQAEWMREQLTSLKNGKFGSKSEAASEEVSGQMMMLFDEAETYAFIEEVEAKKTIVAEHQRIKKEHRFLLDKIPDGTDVVVEEHRLSDEERLCPNCGSTMTEIGKEVVKTLEIVPARFVVHEDHYYTYACKNCNDSEETDNRTQILKTPRIPSVYSGSNASASIVAYLMTQKYVMGVPLYRMEADFKRFGYELSRQTMSNWMIHCSETWLKPVYDELHKRLVCEAVIHADETVLQVLREPGKKAQSKSYMWLYRTGKYAEHPIVLYEYRPGRSGEYPVEFLKGFTGYLQSDGYNGYDQVPDVTHVGCMAHMKRKFHEAVAVLPQNKKSGAAVEGEAYCSALFKLEEAFAELSPEERKQNRIEHSKPVLDEFIRWGSSRNAAPKSKLGIALTYLQNNTKELSEYLNDGRLEISNNLAERSIKPFVIDRKNFLFANTPKGATASAITFSIIETAKENGLNPFRYLTYIFKTAPALDRSQDGWAVQLLPENAPDDCRSK